LPLYQKQIDKPIRCKGFLNRDPISARSIYGHTIPINQKLREKKRQKLQFPSKLHFLSVVGTLPVQKHAFYTARAGTRKMDWIQIGVYRVIQTARNVVR
jgi:hypothetical protein